MDCSEALISITQDPDAAEARAHLEGCADCRVERQRWQGVWNALGQQPGPVLSPAFVAATTARLRAATLERRSAARPRRWPVRVATWGLAAAAGFAVARLGGHHQPTPAPAPVAASAPSASAPVGNPAPLPEPLSAFVTGAVPTDGGRLRAIDMVDRYFPEQGVRPPAILVRALTRTLRADPNPGVRKRAAEALARFHFTPEIRDAFILALRRDGNPAVRIVAIEALAEGARALDPSSIESLRERASDHQESQHLRTVAARALGTISM
jgi:hypothetical protein